MRTLICFIAACLGILIIGPPPGWAQGEYTFFMSSAGPRICIGRWVPPKGVGFAGSCEGSIMELPQLTALSARQSVDRLDQLIVSLNSIDRKLATNLDQTNQLINETRNTQSVLHAQIQQTGRLLHETIARRFESLSAEILASEAFREELLLLKQDILSEVDRLYQPLPDQEAQ